MPGLGQSDLLSMSQQFSGLPMDSLIGGPLNAAATANGVMAANQVKFMLDTCFTQITVPAVAEVPAVPEVAAVPAVPASGGNPAVAGTPGVNALVDSKTLRDRKSLAIH